MQLIKFKDQFENHFFNLELSTGRILKKVTIKFPDDETNGFIIVAEDEFAHIVNTQHIVKITPYINSELPLFSFS